MKRGKITTVFILSLILILSLSVVSASWWTKLTGNPIFNFQKQEDSPIYDESPYTYLPSEPEDDLIEDGNQIKPDLILKEAHYTLQMGDFEDAIVATICNQGGAFLIGTQNLIVSFTINNQTLFFGGYEGETFQKDSCREAFTLVYPFHLNLTQEYLVEIIVDPSNKIEEQNENNNLLRKNLRLNSTRDLEFTCSDSDASQNSSVGKNYFKKGTVIIINQSATDFCESKIILREYFCTGKQNFSLEYINCSKGCSNGACNPENTINDQPQVQNSPSGLNSWFASLFGKNSNQKNQEEIVISNENPEKSNLESKTILAETILNKEENKRIFAGYEVQYDNEGNLIYELKNSKTELAIGKDSLISEENSDEIILEPSTPEGKKAYFYCTCQDLTNAQINLNFDNGLIISEDGCEKLRKKTQDGKTIGKCQNLETKNCAGDCRFVKVYDSDSPTDVKISTK